MLSHLFKIYFKLVFTLFLRRSTRNKVAVFDLDNTIFDTWPLRTKNLSEKEIYLSAPPFKNVINLVKEIHRNNYHVIFLTSRRFRSYFLTLRSLSSHFPFRISKNLILVQKPQDKIYYINELTSFYSEVEYYDDLSHSQEHGEVKYYSDVIDKINTLNVKYFDAQYIREVQTRKN